MIFSKYVITAIIEGKHGIKHYQEIQAASFNKVQELVEDFRKKTDEIKIENIMDVDINTILKKTYYIPYLPVIEQRKYLNIYLQKN